MGAVNPGKVATSQGFLAPLVPQRRPGFNPSSGTAGSCAGRLLFLTALTVVTAAACDTTPAYLKRDIQEKRLSEIGLETVDPSATSSAAGTSFLRDVDVPPIDTRRIGADTASEGYHRYVHRCGTCHSAPSPRARTAAEWGYVLPKMKRHMADAGLIPLRPLDQALILDFLQRNAGHR